MNIPQVSSSQMRRNWFKFMTQLISHPLSTSRQIAGWTSIRPGFVLAAGLGVLYGLLFTASALQRDYPPPPETLAVWIEAWGEFTMLPFLQIPPEQYRMFLAVVTLPAVLGTWILMAGSARLFTLALGKQTTFEQYLNLLSFAFFPFWILSALLDLTYSGLFGGMVTPAFRGEYGLFARDFFVNFPPLMYSIPFGLGGVYNGLAAYAAGNLRWWQAAITGLITFAFPMLLTVILFR